MNKKELIVIGILTAIVIGVIGFVTSKDDQSSQVNLPIGAVASPTIYSDFLTVNNVESQYRSQIFNMASTTRCAIQSPLFATTTLSFDSLVRAASTTDYTLAVGKAATRFGSTVSLFSEAITANGEIVRGVASTTYNSLALSDRIFSPGTWLIVTTSGTPTAMDSGACSAIFNVGGVK